LNRWNLFISFILILLPAFSSAETFSDSAIGFSIELPESADENWVTTLVDPFEYRYFEENTGTYNANIGVMRYTIDSSYAIPDDWCNEISYAYAVYVETHPIYGTRIYHT